MNPLNKRQLSKQELDMYMMEDDSITVYLRDTYAFKKNDLEEIS